VHSVAVRQNQRSETDAHLAGALHAPGAPRRRNLTLHVGTGRN
jgi:hypothetical protein